MQTTILGRTNLEVSVAGLGCGGASRLGMGYGKSEDHAADIVRAAMDLGVTLIDTAAMYGTEPAVGKAIADRRDQVIVSTKVPVFAGDKWNMEPEVCTPEVLAQRIDGCLRRLDTDRIDILNLHGVQPVQYTACRETLLPVLKDAQAQGKARFLGITELFHGDTDHAMLKQAMADGDYDVVMVGFNLLNPSARRGVLDTAAATKIGTQIMFAVRRALQSVEALQPVLDKLAAQGAIAAADADAARIEALVTGEGGASSLADAAYRFCRHTPGADVVLTGTGNRDHLAANIASITAPPLPEPVLAELERLFGHIASVSGD